MLSVSLSHGLINTSTVMPSSQWSEAGEKTQWTPRKAQTCPYRSCPFSPFPFLHLCDVLPAIRPSRKLAAPLVYEECTLSYGVWLSSQCLHHRLWMLWGQRLSHFLSYAMPRAVVELLNTGWKLWRVNIGWKILGRQHSQLYQQSVSPGLTENFKLKPDHWIL